jgi:1-deoxy-D-xylulose-5-phosphate synthase
MILDTIKAPADLRRLDERELAALAAEIREFIVQAVSVNSGHLGSNLGVVELTLALHRVFDSPRDILLWDTGHQAYVHKLVTGRRAEFSRLRQAGGLSGYPSRAGVFSTYPIPRTVWMSFGSKLRSILFRR